MNYIRRKEKVADLISDEDTHVVVELKDQRRIRWPKDGQNEIIEFGSLNPNNKNYQVGGKVLKTL